MSTATEDAKDLGAWAAVILSEPLSMEAKLALQNVVTKALIRSAEAEALREKLLRDIRELLASEIPASEPKR